MYFVKITQASYYTLKETAFSSDWRIILLEMSFVVVHVAHGM